MNKLNTTKKATLILAGALTLVSLGGLFSQFKGEAQDTSGMEISSVQGINIIQIVKKENENGTGTSMIVTYTITPADATELDFNYSIDWTDMASGYESEDWKNDKKVSDFVTYDNDTANKKLTFTCSQPFGNSIKFVMEAQSEGDVSASITLDYTRTITKKATITGNFALTEGQTLNLVKTDPEVSIGSKGQKASDYKFTSSIIYPDNAGEYSYDNLFVDTNVEDEIYQISGYGQYTYNGNNYLCMDDVLEEMKQNVSGYIASFKDLDTQKTFSAADLKSRMSVTYYLSGDSYVSTAFYYNFITKYKDFTDNDFGFHFIAGNTSQKEDLLDEILTLNISPKTMTKVEATSTSIAF